MLKALKKYSLYIPVALLLLLCVIEGWFLIWTPYSYFYSRGSHTPNVDYIATTYGDLVAEDIFITKHPRESRYVTDKYGARNTYMPSNVDILIYGESFGYGAGVGHELTPAAQLSKLTGYSTAVAPVIYEPLADKENIIEKALYTIKNSDPVKPKVILLIYVDHFVWDYMGELNFSEMLNKLKITPKKENFFQKLNLYHSEVKEYFSINSPITIFSRKFKSYIKKSLKRILNQLSLYSMGTDEKYYQNGSEVIGFRALPAGLNIAEIRDNSYDKILKIAENHKDLYEFGLQNDVMVIPLIVPDKSLAYFNQINGTDYYSEFPGVIFEDILRSYSIPVVSVYPEFLEAVRNELTKNGEPVYWGDDTHWNGLGIKISMMKAGEKIKLVIEKSK
tara:strand:- start:374 stop:1546 length:1173 start_codon:yes stop_codon:yes gene_type:complete